MSDRLPGNLASFRSPLANGNETGCANAGFPSPVPPTQARTNPPALLRNCRFPSTLDPPCHICMKAKATDTHSKRKADRPKPWPSGQQVSGSAILTKSKAYTPGVHSPPHTQRKAVQVARTADCLPDCNMFDWPQAGECR